MSAKHAVVEHVSAVQTKSFRGPIPSPDDLSQYERILPGTAERILAMAERQSASRQELERKTCDAATPDTKEARKETLRGQWMSFVITIVAFVIAGYCAHCNQPVIGSVVAGATLASVVSTMINRKGK